MKTWDDWSDKQISSAIVKLKGYRICDESNVSEEAWNHPTKCCYGTFPPENTKKYGNSYIGWLDTKDYCNNPADMWPIILENNIVVTPCMGANIGDATGYSEHENPVISEFNDNSKALRAAAIVFLIMNGVNPE